MDGRDARDRPGKKGGERTPATTTISRRMAGRQGARGAPPLRRGDERRSPRLRARRRRGGHGLQEPQGVGGAGEEEGRRGRRKETGIRARRGQALDQSQPGDRRGPAPLRHRGPGQSHERTRRLPRSQLPRFALRGRGGHFRRVPGAGIPAQAPCLLGLHHRMRPGDRGSGTKGRGPGVREPVGPGGPMWCGRYGEGHPRQLPLQRAGHGHYIRGLHAGLLHGADGYGSGRGRPALWGWRRRPAPARGHSIHAGLGKGIGAGLAARRNTLCR